MFLRGINYDVGTEFVKGHLSRPDFDETIVRKEIEIIKNKLNYDAVRISGYELSVCQRLLHTHLRRGYRSGYHRPI